MEPGMTKTPPRYPYIELMFSLNGQRRGRPRTPDMNPPPACLLADTIERTTTSNDPPYIATHETDERG